MRDAPGGAKRPRPPRLGWPHADVTPRGRGDMKRVVDIEEQPLDPRLTLVTLGVEDLARARAFYETGLGWKVSPASQDDVVFLQLGPLALSLFPRAALAQDAGVDAAGSGFRGITLAHNVPDEGDVDRALSAAQAGGARIVKPAQAAFWGGRTGYFADPDGHLWEVAWNPHFTLTADGALILP